MANLSCGKFKTDLSIICEFRNLIRRLMHCNNIMFLSKLMIIFLILIFKCTAYGINIYLKEVM